MKSIVDSIGCRVALAIFAAANAVAAPDVTGQITSASGAPIEGATVFVYTAAPKTGTSPFCPSCYPDCGKTAKSGQAGEFTIAGLSSQLVFRLLVVAKGHAPQFVPNVEPGTPRIEVALAPREVTEGPPAQILRGRIVDPRDTPVFGAVVDVVGAAFEGGRSRYGGNPGIDPLSVTDENGEFLVTSDAPVVGMYVRITARAFAHQSAKLETGKSHVVKLTEGGTLSGRVTRDGKGVPNVSVGVSAQDRSAGSYAGHFEVGTDEEGRFRFLNLPPRTDYFLYGLMETVGPHGAIPVRSVRVGRDGTHTDVGDVAIRGGHRIVGRIVLEDGGKIPEKTRLLVSQERAWDSYSVEVGAEGQFEIPGCPAEAIALSIRLPGYQVSSKNGSYDAGNRRLVGRVDADVRGLEMLMEKGTPPRMILASSLPRPKPGELPRDLPLRGVEAGRK